MSTPDDDRDGEITADWPGTQSEPAADDGEATTVVPRTPQRGAPPPMNPPARPAPPPAAAVPRPPMSPPQTGQWGPRWQSAPGPGAFPPAGGPWTPPGPPSHYPPGDPPVAPTPRKGRWGLLSAGALGLVVIVVAAAVFVTRGGDSPTPPAARSSTPTPTAATSTASASTSAPSTTAATSPAPTTVDIVQPTALKGLLASAADVTQIANNAMMTPTGAQDSPILGVHVDPFKCTGPVMTAMYTTYIGVGTAFTVQTLNNDPQNIDVIQALTSFPSPDDAKAFVDRQFEDWSDCDGTDITITIDGRYGGPPQHGRLSNSDNTQGANVISILPLPGAEGRQCQHVMSARNNVVVDVRVCAPNVLNMGWDLDQAIGEKITGQR